jgi:acylphosphatase
LKATIRGRVQKVGCRWQVLDMAQEPGFTCYIKNKKDCSVTVFAEGVDKALAQLLEHIKLLWPIAGRFYVGACYGFC